MTNSRDLFARARRRIPGGVNSPVRGFRAVGGEPVFVGRAKGSRIRNVDDVELIDYVAAGALPFSDTRLQLSLAPSAMRRSEASVSAFPILSKSKWRN